MFRSKITIGDDESDNAVALGLLEINEYDGHGLLVFFSIGVHTVPGSSENRGK